MEKRSYDVLWRYYGSDVLQLSVVVGRNIFDAIASVTAEASGDCDIDSIYRHDTTALARFKQENEA